MSAVELFRFALAELAEISPTAVMYLLQHAIVLFFALVRLRPRAVDLRLKTMALCAASYGYPYLITWIWYRRDPVPIFPAGGMWLINLAAVLTLWSMLALGKSFGIRPAWRSLVERGPYRLVRHPIYASYLLGDFGLFLTAADGVLILGTILGWSTAIGRLILEERILAQDPSWESYTRRVPYRLVPGIY